MTTVWSESKAPRAASDRGWLEIICEPYSNDYEVYSKYTRETVPVYDDDIGAWRQQCTAGFYLDYRPVRLYEPSDKPLIFAVSYAAHTEKWVQTIDEAKAFIESELSRVSS